MTTVALSKTESGRLYQLWAYSPSHQQLLLRSPARNDDDVNVDITFSGVELMQDIPTSFQIDSIDVISVPSETVQTFVLHSLDGQSRVRAASIRVERNNKPL